MAAVTYPGGSTSIVNVTNAANFIPELWSDDIIAAYKKALVMGNCVSKINHVGKKGDTIHIPSPTRATASAKAADVAVTITANVEAKVDVAIDKHYQQSRLIEDIVSVQGLDSLRRFYTDDAGYALAKQIDDDIMAQFETLGGGTAVGADNWDGAWIASTGATLFSDTTSGNGADVTAAGIARAMQRLDDADVPMDGRKIVIPPIAKKDLILLAAFISADFVSGRPTVTGTIGNIYGADVIVSSNCPNFASDDFSTMYRGIMVFHKDAIVFAEQMAIRSQVQYKQEYLADLLTSDCLYGVAELRDDAGVVLICPAI
jgi:N4-gp56 family major capsid protein